MQIRHRLSLIALACSTAFAVPSLALANATHTPFTASALAISQHLASHPAMKQPRTTSRLLKTWRSDAPADRYAIALENDAYGDSATHIRYLDQGWTSDQSLAYYFTDQGSQLFDYDLFVNLEQVDDTELFKAPAHMAKFRYLPQRPSSGNPDGLPIGFLKHTKGKHASISMTCGACHTSQINYQGVGMRIDGAGTQADMLTFLNTAEQALTATLNDPGKFDRMAARILGPHPKSKNVAALKSRLAANRDGLLDYFKRNQTPLRDGFARVDAVGRIYNQVLKAVHATQYLTPDAPVSYPFLWDAPHHDYVQWPGLTGNANAGSIGRNAGEVIGVFGDIKAKKQTSRLSKLKGYASSVQAKNLVSYEEWLWQLKSPLWPQDILPKIDGTRVARGKQIYLNQCVACHRSIDRNDPNRLVYAQMYGLDVVNTDSRELTNALQSGQTGLLQGAVMNITSDTKYGATAPVVVMLTDMVGGVLLQNKLATIDAIKNAEAWGLGLESPAKQGEFPQDKNNPLASYAAYKARPLNGIWATAPYLHNGSVPTLYDLLQTASQRPKRFAVGRLEFDPVKVGYQSNPENPQTPYIYDTSLPGNSNQGHEFGTNGLSEEQKLDLLEYLKTL